MVTGQSRAVNAMLTAEAQAWNALARYKFWMFGYHAAQWVLLNRVAQARQSNPFGVLVRIARERRSAGVSNRNAA